MSCFDLPGSFATNTPQNVCLVKNIHRSAFTNVETLSPTAVGPPLFPPNPDMKFSFQLNLGLQKR